MDKPLREPRVGESVIHCDARGQDIPALVTAVWSDDCINIVFVSTDAARQDSYGRQVERETSHLHASRQPAHGMYWRFPEEDRNEYTPPKEV